MVTFVRWRKLQELVEMLSFLTDSPVLHRILKLGLPASSENLEASCVLETFTLAEVASLCVSHHHRFSFVSGAHQKQVRSLEKLSWVRLNFVVSHPHHRPMSWRTWPRWAAGPERGKHWYGVCADFRIPLTNNYFYMEVGIPGTKCAMCSPKLSKSLSRCDWRIGAATWTGSDPYLFWSAHAHKYIGTPTRTQCFVPRFPIGAPNHQ